MASLTMAFASGQNCTADPQYTIPGIYPDSTTGLAPAIVGVPYSETITAITPVDTCIVILFPPCTVLPVDSVVVDVATGLPPGFTVVSETENSLPFKFLGGSTSCMLITGTASPGDEGIYPLNVTGLSWATVFGVPTSQPFVVDWYQIEIIAPTNVGTLDRNKFQVKQNIPNPFNYKSKIEFYIPYTDITTIKIYNVLGDELKSEEIQALRGINNYSLHASDFTNGIYFYKLSYSEQTITKRFVVNK